MKSVNKKNWMQFHTYLSLFFLPVAFIYVLTGSLYIFGIKENDGAKIYDFKLDSIPKNGEETKIILDALINNNLKIPKDTTQRLVKGNPTIGNIKYNASLRSNKDGSASVYVIDRGIYGILLLMHKSNGKKYNIFGFKLSFFDLIAITFSISMMLFYLSGLIVTSFCNKNRQNAFICFSAGLIVTILAIYFSI